MYLISYNVHLNVKYTPIMTGVQFPVDVGPYNYIQKSPETLSNRCRGTFHRRYHSRSVKLITQLLFF
jgi:hypothetical protein